MKTWQSGLAIGGVAALGAGLWALFASLAGDEDRAAQAVNGHAAALRRNHQNAQELARREAANHVRRAGDAVADHLLKRYDHACMDVVRLQRRINDPGTPLAAKLRLRGELERARGEMGRLG